MPPSAPAPPTFRSSQHVPPPPPRSQQSLPLYIPLNDQESAACHRSTNESQFLIQLLLSPLSSSSVAAHGRGSPNWLRRDGRTTSQTRASQFQFTRGDNVASATVTWGSDSNRGSGGHRTRVMATCTGELRSPPVPDRPSEGQLAVLVELSPAAHLAYRPSSGPPMSTITGPQSGTASSSNTTSTTLEDAQKVATVRLLRTLEHITADVLDREALCVVPQHYVWCLRLHVTVLDASGGNLVDAAVPAALAALRHYRLPVVSTTTIMAHAAGSSSSAPSAGPVPVLIPSHLKEPTPLPLHHTPLSATLGVLYVASSSATSPNSPVTFLVDPDDAEESVVAALVTVAGNVHGEICFWDYRTSGVGHALYHNSGGSAHPHESHVASALTFPRLVRDGGRRALALIRARCETLEKALHAADEQANQELLQHYRQQQQHPSSQSTVLPFQGLDEAMEVDDDASSPPPRPNQSTVVLVESAVDESYRRRALDYAIGHTAHKVREDAPTHAARGNSTTAAPTNGHHELSLPPHPAQRQASQLLAAMLQSIHSNTVPSRPNDTTPAAPSESAEIAPSTTERQNHANDTLAATTIKGRRPTTRVPETNHPTPLPMSTATPMSVDSDDEETTLELQSEFATTVTKSAPPATIARPTMSQTPESETVVDENKDDDDTNDLAAAIKKKKSSKKTAVKNRK